MKSVKPVLSAYCTVVLHKMLLLCALTLKALLHWAIFHATCITILLLPQALQKVELYFDRLFESRTV